MNLLGNILFLFSPVNLAAEIKVIMINVKTNFPFSRSIQRELTNLGADIKNGDIALCDLKTAEAVSFVLAKILEFEDDQVLTMERSEVVKRKPRLD